MARYTQQATAALLIAVAGLAAGPAFAQVQAKPVQEVKPSRGEVKQGGKGDAKAEQKGDQKPLEVKMDGEGFKVVNPNEQAGATPAVDMDELVTLSAFTDPVELTTLVDLVATSLQINVVIRGQLSGTVVFNAPVPVKKSELIGLLDMLLEQQNFTITQDRFGVWTVAPVGELKPVIGGETPTTRVFTTPNIRPSALRPAIEAQGGVAAGSPTRPFTYLDELGVIIATDTPRKLAAAEELIKRIIEEFNKAEFIRLPLTHISAPVARERALQLVGQLAQPSRGQDVNQGIIQPQAAGVPGQTGATLNNMGDRLTVDPQGNALIFRGLPAEIDAVKNILTIIDVRNALVPRQYYAGSAARQIADMARAQGLGEVTTIALTQDPLSQNFNQNFNQQFGGQSTTQAFAIGGPVMVVDESRGNIIYYGTPEQQERLDALIKELDTKSDRVTVEVYKVNDAKAVDIAEVIQNLISNTQPLGTSSLLPESGGRSSPIVQIQNPPGTSGDGSGLSLDSGFVIADEANNQILVKAKAGQQAEFAKLIQKLDQRRLQVYIEAKIVAVTMDDRTRLAFETQLINANGTGGVLNTNFGLGSLGTGSQPILNRKTVNSGLSGFTAAIIKSDQVPIIMTALANETDSRVVSTPQLLVDDNEEANVVSVDRQPTSTSQTVEGGGQVVSAGQSAEAGTQLRVKPQISSAGYLRLEYELELSSFTGEAQTVGNTVLPPPSQVNTLSSDSITVPSDSTVIVGGLVVDQDTKSVAKIPLIGDIPLFGKLFSDTRKGDRQTRLYVFLTPRILRDPGFEDLRLLTQGPQAAAKVRADIPTLTPQSININQAATTFAPQPADAPKRDGVEEREVTPVEED